MAKAALRNFVNGEYVAPRDGGYSDVVDPSTAGGVTREPRDRSGSSNGICLSAF